MAKISGKWTFNDVVTLNGQAGYFDFSCNGIGCHGIYPGPGTMWFGSGMIEAYREGAGWLGNYKTIEIDGEQTVDDSFYEWLTANATKVLTIADKLAIITANEQKVYEAGLNKGGYADGFEEGAKTERERFWDRYLHGGERTISWGTQNGLFNGRNFGFDNFYPTCDIKPVGDASYLFYNWSNEYGVGSGSLKQRLEECGVVLDTSKATLLTNAFAYSHITEIPTIDCRGLGSGTKGLFQDGYSRIHSIEKLIVNEDVTFQNWFLRTNVTEMRFEGVIGHDLDVSFQGYNASQSTLSADSIRSIIEHLSDTNPPAGQPKKTLTLSRTAVEKMDISDIHVSTTGPFATTGGTFLPTCELQMKAGERIRVTLDVAEGHHYTDFNSAAQPDWAVGFSFNGLEPYNREETYTAETDGTVYINAYIQTRKACEFTFKIRAVFVDADGNEIDGENIFSIADGDYSYEDWETGAITNYTVKSDWAALEASKSNWTITLV